LILVADDSPTVQRKAQGILQAEGFEVETVSNGVAAIKKLPNLQPILVLADVSMPGKDGYEVCEFVKTSADFRHVPVLLVVSDLEPYDEQRGAQVRADGIIKKPFTPQDLIALVAKFTGLGEAQASQPTLPDTLVASSPAALPEVPPMGPGPEPSTGSQEQDLAALPAGVAFTGPPLDEMPATPAEPLTDISLQPSPEPALPVWPQSLPEPQLVAPLEDVLGGSSEPLLAPTEPFPGFALGQRPEPTPEHIPEAAPEPALVSPELISGTTPEAMPEPSLVIPGPIPEAVTQTAPEPALVSPELISETTLEAMPEPTQVIAEPTPEHIPEAAPESALVSPELISETTPEAMPEPTHVIAEPTPKRTPEVAPWWALVSPELISEPAPEVIPEPTQVIAEPTAEGIPEAAPEPALVSPELISETTPEAAPEQVSVVSEPVAESGLPFTPESVTETVRLPAEAAARVPPAVPVEEAPPPTEPILAEKQVKPIHPPPPPPDLVTPEADRTVAFRVPAEIAKSVLISKPAPVPLAPEPPPLVEGERQKPMAATHLDSFSLTEAAEGQVYAAPPQTEAGPAPEAEVAQPSGAAAGAPSLIDPEWVYIIVHKVVMKMAPPALPPELVEELVRILTREITAELDAASSQVY
jgi:CheY-like chemotaxis protein